MTPSYKKLASAPQSSKVVAVAFDEMSVKEGLTYDRTHDTIEGFRDGTTKNNELASHTIAFIVRGIVK